MDIKITTLSENTAGAGDLLGEWGLSILVEAYGMRLLLDTGQSISATHNADILGINLNTIDRIVISHGHRDHTGGLQHLLNKIGSSRDKNKQPFKVNIIAHPDVFTAKCSRRQGKERIISMPFSRKELEQIGAEFHLTNQPVKIHQNIMTSGEIPQVTSFEKVEPDLYVKHRDSWKPDPLTDDQALIIASEVGLIVILGCAHRGVINTLRHAQHLTGIKKIHTVVGGTHLFNASQEQIWLTINELKEMGVQKLGACHCTGLPIAMLLAQAFGDAFFFNNAGTQTTIPIG